MADLRLPDTVNAAEALFDPVGIPRQIVIHHQMGALKIDTFACGIGGYHDRDIFVLREKVLRTLAFVTMQAAMQCNDCFDTTKKATDTLREISKGIAVLGKDDQFATVTARIEHLTSAL